MASFVYNEGLKELLDGTIDLDTTTLKIMLLGTNVATYAPDRDHEVVDNGADDTSDPSHCEASTLTNYTGGWGGAGRKTPSISLSTQDASDRVVAIIADLVWTALGGAANDTITAAILIKEGGANDTTSRLIAYFDFTNTTSNGTDFTLDFDGADGNIRYGTA